MSENKSKQARSVPSFPPPRGLAAEDLTSPLGSSAPQHGHNGASADGLHFGHDHHMPRQLLWPPPTPGLATRPFRGRAALAGHERRHTHRL